MIPWLIKVGYWREPGLAAMLLSDLPLAQDFVDPSWDSAPERPVVLAYLRNGRVHEQWMGWSDCRICGKENGTQCLTDGVFVWPEGLAHYVEAHSLRPDQSLVAHVMRGGGY